MSYNAPIINSIPTKTVHLVWWGSKQSNSVHFFSPKHIISSTYIQDLMSNQGGASSRLKSEVQALRVILTFVMQTSEFWLSDETKIMQELQKLQDNARKLCCIWKYRCFFGKNGQNVKRLKVSWIVMKPLRLFSESLTTWYF